MVPRPDLTHQCRRDRGHAGGGGARGLGAFEQGHALLEHGDRRVAEAAVLKPFVFAGEAAFRDFGAVIDEALGEEQSLRGFSERRTHCTAMHQLGARAQRLGVDGGAVIGGHAITPCAAHATAPGGSIFETSPACLAH